MKRRPSTFDLLAEIGSGLLSLVFFLTAACQHSPLYMAEAVWFRVQALAFELRNSRTKQ